MNRSESQKEIELYSLVNEFCRVTQQAPDEFNPEKHLPQAQEIVDSLDGMLDMSSRVRVGSHLKIPYTEGSFSHTIIDKKYSKGVDEKRLGYYVIEKRKGRKGSIELVFQDHWDRDKRGLSEQGTLITYINYVEDRKIKQIYTALTEPTYFKIWVIIGYLKIKYGWANKNFLWEDKK